jgi:hypothetical protein
MTCRCFRRGCSRCNSQPLSEDGIARRYAFAKDHGPGMPYFAFFTTFSRTEFCRIGILRYVSKDFRGNKTHRTQKPCDQFLWRYLKDMVFQKIPHTILELKTPIQWETEAISTIALTKVLNNIGLRLRQPHNLRRHHMEHILVYQTSFPSM